MSFLEVIRLFHVPRLFKTGKEFQTLISKERMSVASFMFSPPRNFQRKETKTILVKIPRPRTGNTLRIV
jgi:hypothetical protein